MSKDKKGNIFEGVDFGDDYKGIDLSKFKILRPVDGVINANSQKSPDDFDYKTEYNGLEIFENKIMSIPYLWKPFLHKIGLAALVGESDCGKSTFLSYLALHIALGKGFFMDTPLYPKHAKSIYVSTEDDIFSVSPKVKNQLGSLGNFKKADLKNIEFIFESNNLLDTLEKKLKKEKRDLIIIDAFGDVFPDDLNQNNKVRSFLDKYQNLAKKYECLIIFLHHTKKNTGNHISKDNVIGSQGFEAKMRVVLQLKPQKNGDLNLLVLKGNFIKRETKQTSFTYQLMDNQGFHNTGVTANRSFIPKKHNPELQKRIIELASSFKDDNSNNYNSIRDIVELLKGTEFDVKKTIVGEIVKENKDEIELCKNK